MQPREAGRQTPSAWFYEYLDHVVSTELKAASVLQGATRLRYQWARERQGGTPITQLAGERLARSLRPQGVVLLSTGTGNPVWLPNGETDGPSGLAVLARAFTGLAQRVCLLAERQYLPGIRAPIEAAGVPFLDEHGWRQREVGALAVEFPLGRAAAERFVDPFLEGLPQTVAAIFLEKPGPNALGVFHNSSGKPKPADAIGHLDWLAQRCRARGVTTAAVGDGGNEIGFGVVRDDLVAVHPYGGACGCPCGQGIIDNTLVDVLLPAAVSNWGGYAIAAALAVTMRRSDVLPDVDEVEASIRAPLAHGAFDGYSGMCVPSVDGTSLAANRAVYQLMLEVVRLAGTPIAA